MTIRYDRNLCGTRRFNGNGPRCESRLMWAGGVRARCYFGPHTEGDHVSGGWCWSDEDAEESVERFGIPRREIREHVTLSPRLTAATLPQLLVEAERRLGELPGPRATLLAQLIRSTLIEKDS